MKKFILNCAIALSGAGLAFSIIKANDGNLWWFIIIGICYFILCELLMYVGSKLSEDKLAKAVEHMRLSAKKYYVPEKFNDVDEIRLTMLSKELGLDIDCNLDVIKNIEDMSRKINLTKEEVDNLLDELKNI